jgi:starch-binding outer membrane protein, SusD/RagB family
MKNIAFKLVIILLAVTLYSCEDYLDKKPLTQIGNDDYWQSVSDLENYTLQFYPLFPAINIVGSYTGLLSWDATRGSDTQITGTPSTTWNGTRAPVTSGGNWTWATIRSVNVFFDNYRNCKSPFDSYKHFVGEAHFFKAFLYFEKVRTYGDVPWFTKALGMDSEDLYKPKDSRILVTDSILWHLDKAIEYLDPLSSTKGGNNRLSKEAALLFKSRVALFEGSWQKYHKGTSFGTQGSNPNKYFRIAVDAAEELMKPIYSTGLYSTNSPREDWCKLFSLVNQAGNKEVLLWKRYDMGVGMGHSFQIYVSDRTAGVSVTLQQIQHYLDVNGNPYDYISLGQTIKGNAFLTKIADDCDPRLSQTVWSPDRVMWDNGFGKGIFSKPFLDKSGEYLCNTGFQMKKGNDPKDPYAGSGVSWNTNSITGSIVFRYSEALLNYAEAKYELGEQVDYDKSINLIRKRSGMPDFKVQVDPNRLEYANYGYPVSDELFEIRRERTVELGCEGFRYDDIRRWAAHSLLQGKRPKGYPFDPLEWVGSKINYKTDEKGFIDPYVGQLPNGYGFKPERDYLECIPLNEITLNPNLVQNPGW